MKKEIQPLLTILMSAYNAEEFIKEAIESILHQSFTNFEFIIADDASTDRTRTIINSYQDPRIIYSHNDQNCGKSATINRLYDLACGKYFTIHDADDFSDKDRFKYQLEHLQQNDHLALCGTDFITVDKKGNFFSKTEMNHSFASIESKINESSQFHGPTVVFRKTYGDRLETIYRPYFNNNYEDVDLCYRMLGFGHGENLSKYLYTYRIVENSLCRKKVDIKNRNLYKVVLYLYNQRKKGKKDDLMNNDPAKVDDYFDQITAKYKADTSLIYREASAYYMYWKLYKKAIRYASYGFLKNPFNLQNLRTLIYCIRKTRLR